jgi:hypothetical protein
MSCDVASLRPGVSPSSASAASLLRSPAVTGPDTIFCGKCGTANPADNQYCRRCGHRLSDDVVRAEEPPRAAPQASGPAVVEGIEVRRYPLVDPETGEPIVAEAPADARSETLAPHRRGGTVMWSLGLHMAAVVVSAALAVAVTVTVEREWVERFSREDPGQILADQWRLIQRPDFRDMSDEQRTAELARVMRAQDPGTLMRAQLILYGGLLLGFLVAGFVAGRVRRPTRLMDVGLGGLLTGAVISLCCCNPIVATLGFLVSLGGVWLGRRSGSPPD